MLERRTSTHPVRDALRRGLGWVSDWTLFGISALLFAGAPSYAQDTGAVSGDSAAIVSGVPKSEPPPRGSVTGHVVCDDTHGPARAARVLLFPIDPHGANPIGGEQPLFATTHLDGSFAIPHVHAGEYIAIAMAPGYLSPLDGIQLNRSGDFNSQRRDKEKMLKLLRATAPSVNVAAEGAARVDIDIQRGAVLAGRVLYSDGSPASEISVQVQNVNEPKPASKSNEAIDIGSLFRMFTQPRMFSTDDLGDFRLSGIPPGTYRLAVPESFEGSSFQDEIAAVIIPNVTPTGKLTVYSGNTLHKSEAKTYDLRPGDTVSGIEITLPLNGLHTIKGVASSKSGILLGSGSLDLTDTVDDSITFHTVVHSDGEFAFFGIPEGSYTLKLSNGFAFENPIPENIPEDVIPSLIQQQYKPTHAFAELTQSVVLGADDIDSLTVTPAETKVPEPPAPGSEGQPNPPRPVSPDD